MHWRVESAVELKRQKLHVKDAIERLQHDRADTSKSQVS